MDNNQEFTGIHVQFVLDGTAVAILCLCVLLVALPRSPVVRAIMHNGQVGTVPGTALAAGARACHRAPPGTTAPSSNDDGDEGKENEDNDEEGGQKDKCD